MNMDYMACEICRNVLCKLEFKSLGGSSVLRGGDLKGTFGSHENIEINRDAVVISGGK